MHAPNPQLRLMPLVLLELRFLQALHSSRQRLQLCSQRHIIPALPYTMRALLPCYWLGAPVTHAPQLHVVERQYI
jgi:hypothetical protein